MNKLFIFIIILISCNLNAQELNFSPGLKINKIDFEKNDLETAEKRIFYKYSFIDDIKTRKIKETNTVLLLGEKYINFIDYNKLLYYNKIDSINKIKSFYDGNEANEIFYFRKNIKFKPLIIGHIINGKVNFIFQDKISNNNYEYDYEDYILNWELTNESKMVNNYNSKKALLNYGGRKWIAYYTEEIPLNFGPYIFNGLPGLILEIYDEDREHIFQFEGIESNKSLIFKISDNIEKVTKQKFIKGLKKFYDNPENLIGNSYSSPGISEVSRSIPYNFIEKN